MKVPRVAFVLEQTLGHVTHSRNLRAAICSRTDLAPVWLPIPFAPRRAERLVPLVCGNWSVRASWRARRALRQVLGCQPLDAIVFHTQVTALFSTALMQRVPSIVSLDATPINYDSVGKSYGHRPAGDGPLDHQKFLLNRRAFEGARALVAWSEWAKRSLVEDYGVHGERVHVLAPGAAPAYFAIGARRLARGQQMKATGERVRLLFVGGDFARKGGQLLLEAMRTRLADSCELDIVTHTAVPTQPNVRVHHGVGPNSAALLDLFERADIFVLPSLGDCLAVVLMEAAAAGLPIVTTRVGALPEAVKPRETGVLVPPGDAGELAAALSALADDAALRHRQGRAGMALARAKFDAVRNARALVELVKTVAGSEPVIRRAA